MGNATLDYLVLLPTYVWFFIFDHCAYLTLSAALYCWLRNPTNRELLRLYVLKAANDENWEIGKQWRYKLGLGGIVLAGLAMHAWYAARYAVPFADTTTYVDMGRNLLKGRGFVATFNPYFGWSGTISYPALAYYNPLAGIWFAALWQATRSVAGLAICATVLPCAVNAALIGCLLRRSAGELPALSGAASYFLLPTTWISTAVIGLEHLMVTICLVLVLLVQDRDPRLRWPWIAAGLLIAIGALVKVTMWAAIPALLVGLAWTREGSPRTRLRQAVRPAGWTLFGLLLVMLPYEAACVRVTGTLYPQYPRMALLWAQARWYGGDIVTSTPAIRPRTSMLPGAREQFRNGVQNLNRILGGTVSDIGLLSICAIIAVLWARRRLAQSEKYLLVLATVFPVMYALAYVSYPFEADTWSALRYALHTSAFVLPVAIAALWRMTPNPTGSRRERSFAYLAIWMAAILSPLQAVAAEIPKASRTVTPRASAMQQFMNRVDRLVPPHEIVAFQGSGPEMAATMFLDRPVVAIPESKMDVELQIARMVAIYSPGAIVPGRSRNAARVAVRMGYVRVPVVSWRDEDAAMDVYVAPNSAGTAKMERERAAAK